MKERPILFNSEMVRAILDGHKTQIRRPIKGIPLNIGADLRNYISCPFGSKEDHMWVRETFCLEHSIEGLKQPFPFNDGRPVKYFGDGIESSREYADEWVIPHYLSTDPTPELRYEDSDGEPTVRWIPSIHMPRWVSRIFLEITDVRVEKIQDLTYDDCAKEGDPNPGLAGYTCFEIRWNSLYAKKGFGWNENPWVWVITFKRTKQGENPCLIDMAI